MNRKTISIPQIIADTPLLKEEINLLRSSAGHTMLTHLQLERLAEKISLQ